MASDEKGRMVAAKKALKKRDATTLMACKVTEWGNDVSEKDL